MPIATLPSMVIRRVLSCRPGAFARRPSSPWRDCATGFALVLFAFVAASAAASDRIGMRIEMFGLGGVHVATNHTTVEAGGNSYAIATDAESRGIASLFIALTSHSEVRGTLAGDAVRPQAYRGDVRRNGVDTRNRVEYGADGSVLGQSTPPREARVPVTPALMRGTVDQLTAFFMMERQLARRGSCALVVAVYDGLRRYDLHFADAAPEPMPAASEQRFGPAQVCRMRREAIAGFLDDGGRSEGAYAGKLWYARLLPDDLMIPVRMEFMTEFGPVIGQLAELHGRGVDLRWME